jgi:hypothetical protein
MRGRLDPFGLAGKLEANAGQGVFHERDHGLDAESVLADVQRDAAVAALEFDIDKRARLLPLEQPALVDLRRTSGVLQRCCARRFFHKRLTRAAATELSTAKLYVNWN